MNTNPTASIHIKPCNIAQSEKAKAENKAKKAKEEAEKAVEEKDEAEKKAQAAKTELSSAESKVTEKQSEIDKLDQRITAKEAMLDGLVTETAALRKEKYSDRSDGCDGWKDSLLASFSANLMRADKRIGYCINAIKDYACSGTGCRGGHHSAGFWDEEAYTIKNVMISFAASLQATLKEIGSWLVWLANILHKFNDRELYRADKEVSDVADAGVPLDAIHIGGDEVPEGAWTGSPACKALSDSLSLVGYEGLNDYFLNRVLDIAEERNVKIAGWQEIALNIRPETRARLRKSLFFANLWSVSRGQDELAYEFANEGLGVVLSNAPNYYFDLAYNASNTERGYNWAGFVDERRCFSLLPYNVYAAVRWDDKGHPRDISSFAAKTPLKPEGFPYILGVQRQLWGETLRNFDHVTYYLFPKALGLFERGWNARPDWESSTVADDPAFNADFAHFFSIITGHEYAWYDSFGIDYHRHE